MTGSIGQQVASDRMQAGRDIAGQYQNTANQMANYQNQLGQNYSSQIGSFSNNLANMLSGLGGGEAGQNMQLAQLMANLGVGQGTQLSNMNSDIGAARAAGITGQANAINNTIGTGISAFMMSDRRLKTDIQKQGDFRGLPFYEWKWKDISGLAGKGFGFMSDEVKKLVPTAVVRGADGYDRVNYGEVFNGL